MFISEAGKGCVLLAIDPGAKAGAAIFVQGELAASLSVTNREAAMRREFVEVAIETAGAKRIPLIVVRERWAGGGKMGARTAAGLGAAWGAWREWLYLGGVMDSKIVKVYASTWQSSVLGTNRNAKALAVTYVGTRFGRDVEHDEADAICIGAWALGSEELTKAMPKRKARVIV